MPASVEDITRQLSLLGRTQTPDLVAATSALFRPLHEAPRGDVSIGRHSYGPHPRHRLSVFRPPGAANAPVLVFVTGGGLMVPIMSEAGSPFFDNVGLWAARHHMVGVTITCRLAPEVKWPAGGDDVAQAVRWVHDHVASRGGDPARIVVMGHSAGAGHTATYLASEATIGIAGAVLISGLYNTRSLKAPNRAYFGDDPSRYPDTIPGVIRSGVPLMLATAKYDPPDFEFQARELMEQWQQARGAAPEMLRLGGHNHVSIVQHINAFETELTRHVLDFVRHTPPVSGHRAPSGR